MILFEVLNRTLAVNFFVFQKIRQDFQEMRFAAAEEAADPDPHFVSFPGDAFFICFKEPGNMFLQFSGNNIFFQFLLDIGFFILADFDNAFHITGDGTDKHFLNCHDQFPP